MTNIGNFGEYITGSDNYSDTLSICVGRKYKDKDTMEATFQVTENCTLACTYCYQHDKHSIRMSFDTARKYIDLLFDNFKDSKYAIILDFIGGEPLLEPELISKIVDYWDYQCIMHYPELPWGMYTRVSFASNGTEWPKPEVQKLIKKLGNRLSLSFSIDGDKKLHDSARVHPDGRGSYDEAKRAADEYEKMMGLTLGSKMTIAPSNIWYLYPAIKHYLDTGRSSIFANTVFEDVWKPEHASLFYEELKKIADYKIDNYPKVYLSLFQYNTFEPNSPTNNQAWCGGNGRMISCGPDGTIYPCQRYAPASVGHGRDDYLTCGHVDTGIDTKINEDLQLVNRRVYSNDECYYCPIGMGCADCAALRWEVFGTIEKRTTFHCEMHKARSLGNVYYWNKLYLKYDIPKVFEMNCPRDWALKIISEDEYNMLEDLVIKARNKKEELLRR